MKRMKPEERKSLANETLSKLVALWTCRLGAWNRDKVLLELEKQLKQRRKEKV